MLAKRLTPILNVSDIVQSFAWFETLGWRKGWDWGTPPTFGAVCSGEFEIFLCLGAQGGRGILPSVDADDGQVGFRIGADERRRKDAPIMQRHFQFARSMHHVAVR